MLKKIYIMFALVLSVFLLSACNEKNESSEEVINVAMSLDYPPFGYYNNGEMEGIDIDLAKELEKELGKKFVITDMPFNTILTALHLQKTDLGISAFSIVDEREKNITFSEPYYFDNLVIVVKNDNNDIKSAEDLKGKHLGSEFGSHEEEYIDTIENSKKTTFKGINLPIIALESGKIDAFIAQGLPAMEIVNNNKNVKIASKIDGEGIEIAMALNKEDTEMLEKINEALAKLKENGKLDEIINKYLN